MKRSEAIDVIWEIISDRRYDASYTSVEISRVILDDLEKAGMLAPKVKIESKIHDIEDNLTIVNADYYANEWENE